MFGEVGFGGRSKRADMVCRRDGDLTAVEVKLGLNLKVIDQAYGWRERSNYVYVAVPARAHRNLPVARAICESFGIGLLIVYVGRHNQHCEELVSPTRNTSPTRTPELYEEQKSSVASNADSQYVTPFKVTAQRLVDLVRSRGECLLTDAVAGIEHHYANDKSAIAGLKKLIGWGVVPELECAKSSGRIVVRMSA